MHYLGEWEIAVVGGGIAGVSAAYHLSLHGHRVALIERGEIASEASRLNAGLIGAMGWGHKPGLQSHLTMGSLDIFRQLQLDQGYAIEFRQSGSLEVVHSLDQMGHAQRQVGQLRSDGHALELLTAQEARSIEPELSPGILGAMYRPLAAQANPQEATGALAIAASRAGVQIYTGHEVSGIRQLGDLTFDVKTAQGALGAGLLVIAAGAWCATVGGMLGLNIPIVPVRGQMWASAVLPPRLHHTITSIESACYWDSPGKPNYGEPVELTHRDGVRVTRHLYGRQSMEGEIIFGGDREFVGYNQTPDPLGIAVNREHATQVFPFLGDMPIGRTWAGLMPFSLDGLPLIGRLPHRPNLYIVSGLGPSGFGRGPMAGKLLADYIHTGAMPGTLAEADPARCVTLAEG